MNFFVDDEKFERLYSAPDRYVEHLKCFESICGYPRCSSISASIISLMVPPRRSFRASRISSAV
ncbi:DUF4417 domain-containing protein [Blautia hydrogenotrophica]|uniref:DUF4417 domain-containing protein n=1 Tax=Blautia hydrogenotrophica TaxID=53443 RepID=UPI00399C02B8